jgi:hypothetical protein
MSSYDILSEGEAMARGKMTEDLTTLRMALIGYQMEKDKIDSKIKEIQAQLRGTNIPAAPAAGKPAKVKRVLSPEARKRIAAAQKKRWAEHRKAKGQQA